MNIQKIIEDYAAEHGFIVGFCAAGADEAALFETAKTVIVIGVGYGKKENFATDDIPRGRLASYAIGTDYHITVRNILSELRDYLHGVGMEFDSHIHVDSGPLPERHLALKAGIGKLGRNSCIISEKFGSFFNIGCMLVSIPIVKNIDDSNADAPHSLQCGNCTLCLTTCPTNALTEAGFDYTKCISYITQKKGELSNWEQQVIGQHLFGCDVCQSICPRNVDRHVCEITDINETLPPLESFIKMTKSEFKEKYGNTAAFWRGLSTVKRNANAILNSFYKKGDN